jgi:hypothetical protein
MTRPIEPPARANLLKLATAYCVQHDCDFRYVSRLAHGDAPFFDKLKQQDGSFTARKYDEVVAWFTKQARAGVFKMPLLVDLKHHQRTPANGSKTKTIRNRKKEDGRDKGARSRA